MHPRLHTRFCDLFGIEYPIVQTGMGWVVGRRPGRRPPRRPAGWASSPAPPWTSASCRTRSREVKTRTPTPFGVNLRADAADIDDRVKLLIDER